MLLLIIVLLIIFAQISNCFSEKTSKLFIFFSILIVLLFYFFLAKTLFNTSPFVSNKENAIFIPCGNYYNLLVDSIKDKQLNIVEVYPNNKNFLLDTSLYKDKIYLYFGITPVFLFYLPFHLITNYYLTDRFLTFMLSCLSFLFSLFFIRKTTENYKHIPSNIKILSIFLVGFCNLLPFLIVNGFIYQVAVLTANVLLLGAFCLFYFLLHTKSIKVQNVLIFFISLLICLSVGARPHYVLFIPVFLFFIIYSIHTGNIKTKDIFKTILIFLIPCIVYGSIIALYNYLRFDSIFEFGWKYQYNEHMQMAYVPTIKDFIIGLKNNFLLSPNMDEHTIFSLTKTSGHRIGNEYITGILWTCPIILMLFFIPNFLKKTYNTNKKIFILLSTLVSVAIINIILTSFFGMIIRYIFEFLSLMIILSIITFLFYTSETKDKTFKIFLNFLFVLIFIFSIFINTSLLFCRENFWIFKTMQDTNYTKIVEFLF